MISLCFDVFVFLATVRKTEDTLVKDPTDDCFWQCKFESMNKNVSSENNWKIILNETGQMRAKFRVNMLVEQDCSSFKRKENTSESIEVWIYQASSIHRSSDFGLLLFAIMSILDDVTSLRFLFPQLNERNYPELEVNNSISCDVRRKSRFWQTSNECKGLCGTITSPYFFLNEVDNFTQNKAFLSYIWWKNILTFCAGFTNPDGNSQAVAKNVHHRQIIEGRQYILLSFLSHVVGIFFTLYGVYYLMHKFQPNVSTVEIPGAISPVDQTEESKNSSRNPSKQGVGAVLPVAKSNLHQPDVASVTPSQQEPTLQEDNVREEIVLTRLFKEDSALLAPEPVTSIEEHRKGCTEESKCVQGLVRSTKDSKRPGFSTSSIPPGSFITPQHIIHIPDADPFSLIQSGDSITEANALNQETQTQAGLWDNRKRKAVRVIHLPGDYSLVGLTSFISNTLLKSKYVGYVNLSFFIIGPLFLVLFLDFLCLPGAVLRSSPSLTSTSLTKAVLLFAFKQCPLMLACCVAYIIRCGFLCFCKPSRKTWVPAFVFRKHVLCFVRSCYVTQLFIPSSACEECKERQSVCLQDINITENLRQNFQSADKVIIKNWKDVFGHLLPILLSAQGDVDESTCRNVCIQIKRFCFMCIGVPLCYIFIFILFLILCVLDLALSSPIVSFCFLRVWFTVYCCKISWWILQPLLLFVEFLFICCSVAWAVYISFCCSVSLKVAVAGLFLTGAKYFKETLLTYATIILFWYVLLGYYRLFTDKYDNLNLMLFNTCKAAPYKEQLQQYQQGDGIVYFPEDLVLSVQKVIPLEDSIRRLIQTLIFCFVSFTLIMLGLTRTELPNTDILTVAVTVLAVVPPALKWLFFDRGKFKELKDAGLEQLVEEKVKEHLKQKKN